jgi:uncharacterized protein YfkK (UPF0435 family)
MLMLTILTMGLMPEVIFADNTKSKLATIDSLINHHEAIMRHAELHLEKLKTACRHQHSLVKKFDIYRTLFKSYTDMNTDSALSYADKNIKLSKALGGEKYIFYALLDKANVLIRMSQLSDGKILLDRINRQKMDKGMKIEYLSTMYFLYSRYAEYNDKYGLNSKYYYQTEFTYGDSALKYMERDNPNYPLYKGWQYMRRGHYREGISLGENYLAFRPENDIMKSQILYMMSMCYKMLGNTEKQIDMLSQGTINDLKIANNNYESLRNLSYLIYQKGYVSEAYRYIHYELTMAIQQRDRIRVLNLLDTLDMIQKGNNKKIAWQSKRLLLSLTVVVLLTLLLAITLFLIIRQYRRISQQRLTMKDINEKLKVSNDQFNLANKKLGLQVEELKTTHAALKEANSKLEDINNRLEKANTELGKKNMIKEEYIGFVLLLCSDYISKIDNYRKNINRKIRLNMFRELKEDTDSQTMLQSELKEFYQHFDTVFLHVYPQFVKDFNTLLRSDEQIKTKEGSLNTELRIYALMRLGITDSNKIADFLHCSVQTVYNNRLRTRQKAIDREKFDEKVRELA